MRQREPKNEEQGPSISRVPHISIESPCDKLVVRLDCQIEGEKWTQSFETVEADISA